MKLGNRIKELRESQGLFQRQLSAQLDIDTPKFIVESDATIVAPLIFAYVLGM